MYKILKNAANFILDKLGRIDVAIITGTGIDIKLEGVEKSALSYEAVPDMPVPSTKSHKGYFSLVEKGNLRVVIAYGRFHFYERYSMQEVIFLPRVLGITGAKLFILTNAAGGLNPHFKKGDLMIVCDHINLMGVNPLKGDNIEELGDKFPDMSEPYNTSCSEKFKSVAMGLGIDLKEGVYVGVAGPSLETPAETRFFRLIGGDAIGMSTVPEVIALNHMGIKPIVISVITNVNRPDCMEKTTIDDVIEAAAKSSGRLSKLIDRSLGECI